MILFLDTSDPKTTRLGLLGKKIREHYFESEKKQSEILLPEIVKFLKKDKIALRQISKLAVVTGPGHFSRIRTGVATVNALAFALNLPVVSIRKNASTNLHQLAKLKTVRFAVPFYGKAPNITKPKSKK